MLSSRPSVPQTPAKPTNFADALSQPINQPTITINNNDNDVMMAPAKPTERLIVDYIVLENFKSYAGRQVVGPFDKNFSSIVGPNGSGKSNVIDAFMFVLGYRAKKLRQAKLSELIHNSEGLMNLDYCSVEVHFKVLKSEDGSESDRRKFTVSRTAYRNNKSVYHVDGVTSNYTEVTDLLKGYGVDLDHKRFLILQGEVESIAQMKPKASTEYEEGLLEYLEDIIGTNKYIEKIEEAGKAVDALNEQVAEKNVRVKAAEKEVAALLPEKNLAESYIRQENQLIMKKADLYQVIKYQAGMQIEKLSEKLEQVRHKLEEESKINQEQVAEVEQMESQLKGKVNEYGEVEKQFTIASKKLTTLEKEDIKHQETRKHLKNKVKQINKSITDESKSKSNLERELGDIDQEIGVLQQQLQELQGQLGQSEGELNEITEVLKGKTEELQVQLEDLQKQMAPWNEKIRVEEDALKLAKSALNTLEKKQQGQENELEATEKTLQSVMTELQNTSASKERLQEEQKHWRGEVSKYEAEIGAGEKFVSGLAGEVSSIQNTIAEANEALRQSNTGGAILNALMRESSSGRIRGVYGRLGDLGIIDSKYDVAISTACSSLNYIVVDTTQTGQKCVEFLRAKNLGRASFIILEKMRPADMNPQLPNGANRLFDLVQVQDSKFLNAFYFALTDTLVADNMEQATKWAYGERRRYRVVTLDGKLIDTSGTMSGGGNHQQSGGMKASFVQVDPEQVNKLTELLNEKLAEQKAAKSHLLQFQELLAAARLQVKKIEMELGKIEIACQSLPMQIEDLKQNIQSLRCRDNKPSKEDGKKIEGCRREIAERQGKIDELMGACRPLQSQLDQVQNQILEAGGMKLKAQRAKVSGFKDQISLIEKRISKLTAQKATLSRQATDQNLESERSNELKKLEEELTQVEREIEEATMAAVQIKAQVDSNQSRMTELKEEIDEMKKAIEKLSKVLSKFLRVEFEFKSEIEKLEGQVEENRQQLDGAERSLSGLELNSTRLDDQVQQSIAYYEDEADLKDLSRGFDQLKAAIKGMEEKLATMQPNLKVIEEYKQREEVYLRIKNEFGELEMTRDRSRQEYESLRKQRHDEFMQGFRLISLRLKELYQLITMGGNAELELVDSLDPFAEGIIFSVMPPKKSWKNISNLSGGEKTLSSLALVFALHAYKPTPIYVMDEIDAALDFRNVSIVANYIKERTRDAQFIVISLRNNMFELADRLVGIYKTKQKTKSVTIDPNGLTVCLPLSQMPQTHNNNNNNYGFNNNSTGAVLTQ